MLPEKSVNWYVREPLRACWNVLMVYLILINRRQTVPTIQSVVNIAARNNSGSLYRRSH